ncbi:response regulator transcription factor [Kaistella sp. G5-32]|uniref:Response regulator transcription factor n=1 Tax=Kaistella gelatinilytica TaxID=2787636 RepID=A0ABS0F9F0_9FLAO|nr:response regulator transcription factor [Kaistella gelatinilytica]MBF8456313.1 response regulator transcription factor [Kaistella gelatinilytica]
MENTLDVVIIDDHNIIIEGLEMLLSFEKNVRILKTYNDAYDFLGDLRGQKLVPKILLMDLMMPTINGLESSKIIKKEFPEIKIIILSMNCEPKVIYELIEKIEVEGYLSKKISRTELYTALNEVNKGYVHLSEEAQQALNCFREKIISYPEIKLSCREKEIVDLMINGFSNREISAKLFISESTVETHRKNIYRKTEAHSIPKLIQIVNDLNLLQTI